MEKEININKTFTKSLKSYLHHAGHFKGIDTQALEQLAPLDDALLEEALKIVYSREPEDVSHFLLLNGLEAGDGEELISKINQDLQKRSLDTVVLENRNIVAISGNCAVIRFLGNVIKYPLNEYLAYMIIPEIENHKKAYELYTQWREDQEVENQIGFEAQEAFGIPGIEVSNGVLSTEYVGKSIDSLILQDIILDVDPQIDQKLRQFNRKIRPLKEQSNSAQIHYILHAILSYNIPELKSSPIDRSSLLSILIHCKLPYISKKQCDALNSFLDFALMHGFKYMDKVIDNLTRNGDRMYLIDFGICDVFAPQTLSDESQQEYRGVRKEMIDKQLAAFVQ